MELLGEHLGLEEGARVAGSRFVYLKGPLVRLEFALVQWALDLLEGKGFTPVVPPVLVREQALFGTGMLPDTEQQIYRVPEDELFLAGTSEVPLASLHAGEILGPGELPRRYAGFSTCFRREAGAAGKDTQGIFRVHQFDKVEMFSFVEPEQSGEEHERLLAIEEEILGALEIPYRVVNIAAHDLGNSAAKKYDLEAWLPGQERYRELTSCSNTTAFQARRLEIRHRPEEGASPRPRAHAQRHGGRGRPHDHRDRREPPARGRDRGGARGAAPVRRAGDDLTLEGPRVRLVPVAPEHHERLNELRRLPEVVRWWKEPWGDWLADEADTVRYAVLLEGEIVGYAQWWEDGQPLYRHAGVDLFLDPAVHGRGLGTETLRVICAHLIDEHGFHRLVIDPEAENEVAIASLPQGRVPAGGRHAALHPRQPGRLEGRPADGPARRGARPRLAVEAHPEAVQHPQPGTAAAGAAVGPGEGAPGERDAGPAQRLGRERDRAAAHHAQPRALGLAALDEVERDLGAEAARRHPEAGVADREHRPAAERLAEHHGEARAGVDRATPAVGEAQPASCGKVSKKWAASSSNEAGRSSRWGPMPLRKL